MRHFLTPVLVIWSWRRRHPCCLLGDQHGRTLLHSEIRLPLKPIPALMTMRAAPSVMTLISLGARASVGAAGALTCLLCLFWDLTRLMRTSVLHVAANSHVSIRFRHVLHLSLSSAFRALFMTHQVRRFGVRNRATHVMTRSSASSGSGVMCHLVKLWRPHKLY